jgi:hypothetical protein
MPAILLSLILTYPRSYLNLLLNVKPEITRDIDLQFADFQGTARIFIFSNLRVKKQAKGY